MGREGDRGMMAAVSLAATGTWTRSAVAAVAAVDGHGGRWDGHWRVPSSLPGSPCHSGGLVGWVRSAPSEPSPPLFVPVELDQLAGRKRLGRLVPLGLSFSGLWSLFPPTSYRTAALFLDNGSLMPSDDRPLMLSPTLYNVMQLLDNQGVGSSTQCRHIEKPNPPARQPGCQCHCCRSDRQP